MDKFIYGCSLTITKTKGKKRGSHGILYAAISIFSIYVCFFIQEENVMDPPQPVQRGVTELVEAALNPRNLCMMDPTWHPWF